MSANVEVVQRLAGAFEEGDLEAALACLDPEVELRPIRAELEGGSYVGHDGYRRLVADFEEDWEGLRIEPKEFRERGDLVVAVGRVLARGRASGVELEIELGLLYELRGGRVVRIESHSDPAEALRAAGIDA